MFELIISIAISLNIHYTVLDDKSISFRHEDAIILSNSDQFLSKLNDGSIHDLILVKDDQSLNDIIVIPEVDPLSTE